jgi:general stress protein YciG
MPIGNNSLMSENDGAFWRQPQGAVGISEPGSAYGQTGHNAVHAKEPDRQGATRRGAASRSRMESENEEQDQPRSRSQRSAGRSSQARRGTERTGQARRSATPAARQKKSRRGFAAMSSEQQREIARKGGLTVSRNRRHMADIGRIGGEHSHGGRRSKARR